MILLDKLVDCPIYVPPSGTEWGNYHFEGVCEDCDARVLSRATLAEVEERYRRGSLSHDQFEAYMHCWATGAPRFSSLGDGWTDPPTDPTVARIATRIRRWSQRRKS